MAPKDTASERANTPVAVEKGPATINTLRYEIRLRISNSE
jgi:hypothetical protein